MKKASILVQAVIAPLLLQAQSNDLNIALMHATVKIQGLTATPGKNAEGTVFFLSYPMAGTNRWGWNMMVTAAHVLEDIKSDTAVLFLHKKTTNSYEKLPSPIVIRKEGKPLWYKHPEVDVAVMIAPLKKDYLELVKFLPASFLTDDAEWEARFIHPGDEVFCLGYPLGLESSAAGFPILRSGRIASFPLLPTKTTKTFQLDLRVFGGNSGGPVYFQFYGRRPYLDFTSPQVDCSGILGIMIQDISHMQTTESYFGSSSRKDPLGIAIVVHASFIKEAIQTLVSGIEKAEHP